VTESDQRNGDPNNDEWQAILDAENETDDGDQPPDENTDEDWRETP